jgi:hypothetical protein
MSKLNFYNEGWPLKYSVCPCDVEFILWLRNNKIINSNIFHFGTGSHHFVGSNTTNSVLGITASVEEYQEYIKLSIDKPHLSRNYKVFFGDIYLLDYNLLPEFDVVTLFHLCEFRTSSNDEYGAMTDLELLSMLTDKVKSQGYLLFYTGSNGFNLTKTVIENWLLSRTDIEEMPKFKSLQIFRKI